jgi:PAS domain S-box-containing protein
VKHALVVDDKDENLYYLEALLGGHGLRVTRARHGAEALVLARREPPDVVVSDLLMPVMDGYTLLRYWKADERLRTVPFIVYTATYTEEKDERLALDLGADAFILKPSEPEDFLARLRVVGTRPVATPVRQEPPPDEDQLLKVYNETLVRKLEKKAMELEEANAALRRDVARRELAEAALRDSEQRFRQLAENIEEVFWISDADKGRVLYVSPAYEAVWGRSVASLYARPGEWLEAIHPADRERVAHAAATLQAQGLYDETYRIVRPDGGVRWIRDRAFPVADTAQGPARVVGTAVDVTDMQLAQQALREREREQRELAQRLAMERQQLVAAQSVAKVGSWEIDLQSRAMTWSAQLHCIFDTDAAAVQPTLDGFLAQVLAEDRATVAQALQHALEQRSGGSVMHRLQPVGGRSRVVEEHWQVVAAGPDGGRACLLGTCQDISERLELEDQLRRAQRLESVGQLTGGVAHDFNNLLTVILGNAEVLAEDLAGNPQLEVMAQVVMEAAQRGADLTQRLLAFARKQALVPQAVDVNQLVAGMSAMLRRTLGEHIRIAFAPAPELWSALVDPAQLDNTLLNLCLNARDAMPQGGRLLIETDNVQLDAADAQRQPDVQPGPYVMLSVSDTGTGIPPELLGRVFEPFFTTKEKGKGTGLGLAMTYGFVKQSGGHVSIKSQPGLGTTVRLYLPRAAEAAGLRGEGAGKGAPSVGGAETILLVEDDELVRRYAQAQLAALGYRVLHAEDGQQALLLLQGSEPVDLLFTDVVMPGMSGRELAQQALAQRPRLRVLYTSGYTEDAIVREGRFEPGVRLLAKPYRRDELARSIRGLLDAPASPSSS